MTKWVAMDSDGDVCIYKDKPILEMYIDGNDEQAYAWCGGQEFKVLYTVLNSSGYAQSLREVEKE